MSKTLRQFGRSEGFTLIELLIVVAIIGIIAAIAIPSLLRSRMSANEAATVGNLRAIVGANTDYNNNIVPHTYADSLQNLATGTGAGGIDFLEGWTFNGAVSERSGYTIAYAPSGQWAFEADAEPMTPGSSGSRHFVVSQAGVVCSSEDATCTAGGAALSPPCGPSATCLPIQ